MKKFTDKQIEDMGITPQALPRHVGIIMDGNGRWATQRGLARGFGHRAGVERLKGIIRTSSDLGIEALSLYAFSTENWGRPKAEVGTLVELFIEYFMREIDELDANGVCIRALGDISAFPQKMQDGVVSAQNRTAHNSGLKLNIALNYGSRTEIASAVKAIALDAKNGSIDPESVDWETVSERLYTHGLPDVDLVIRTGGEKRLSNFLLMQNAYAEFIFVQDYWPDYSDERYIDALREFSGRNRRFGGLK